MRAKGAKDTDHINWSDYFYYDEASPSGLRWATDRWSGKNYSVKKVSKGDPVGTRQLTGYWATHFKMGSFKIHRIVWELCNGEIPKNCVVDHMDGDNYNNTLSNLRIVSERENNMNTKMYKNNTTGIVGVYLDSKKDRKGVARKYFKASWMELDGKQKTKAYSVESYGEQEAFRLACEHRAKMIKELNSQGAGYTERHGK